MELWWNWALNTGLLSLRCSPEIFPSHCFSGVSLLLTERPQYWKRVSESTVFWDTTWICPMGDSWKSLSFIDWKINFPPNKSRLLVGKKPSNNVNLYKVSTGLTAIYSFCAHLGFILKVHVNLAFHSIYSSIRYVWNDLSSSTTDSRKTSICIL